MSLGIHLLARANESHTRPAVDEQCVPALSGTLLESSQPSKEIKTTLQKLLESTSSSEVQKSYHNLENNSEMKRLIQTLTEFEDTLLVDFLVIFLEMVEILARYTLNQIKQLDVI